MWISIKDKLPDEGCWVLFCERNKQSELGMVLDGVFCLPDLGYLKRPNTTHWMYLPQSPGEM